ncbi:MAG TPA: TMEM175 family protein [Xanthomonadaceae bacterium]|nr:TMEM175 family protein [Xanthomonadaceae bacterium]
MGKARLEAFSDGVIAIIITIMVLELRAPPGTGLAALRPLLPVFLSYVLSFAYVGIYWVNHHHFLHAAQHVSGKVLWANLFLLFWLSLFPFATAWMGENHFAAVPVALYGVVLLMAALAWRPFQASLIAANGGRDSLLARATAHDWKGLASPVFYAAAIALAFVHPALSGLLYVAVAVMWLVPDRRIESRLTRA